MNNNKFFICQTQTVEFGFNIFDVFSQVLLQLFTFLINTTHFFIKKINNYTVEAA